MDNPYAPSKAALPDARSDRAPRRERILVGLIFAVCVLPALAGLFVGIARLLMAELTGWLSAEASTKVEWLAGVFASLSLLLAGVALLRRRKIATALFLPMTALLVYRLSNGFFWLDAFWLCLYLSCIAYSIVLARRGRLR